MEHLREECGGLGLDEAVGSARGVRAAQHAHVVETALDDARAQVASVEMWGRYRGDVGEIEHR